MKKIFFLTIFSLYSLLGSSQIQKGNTYFNFGVGSDIANLSYSKTINTHKYNQGYEYQDTSENIAVLLSSSIGYFLTDQLGMSLVASTQIYHNISKKYTYKYYNFGTELRYYMPLNSNFLIFDLGVDTERYLASTSSSASKNWSIYGGLGLVFPITKRASFDAFMNYRHSRTLEKNVHRKPINNLTLNLGFSFYFKSQKEELIKK